MEVLKDGIYLSKSPSIYFEEHGGVKIKHISLCHFCFKNKTIGVYFTDNKWVEPYFNFEIIKLKTKISSPKNGFLEFCILNPISNANIKFFVKVYENGKLLNITAWDESKPEKILIDDDFEWLDLDYKKLEKEFGE
jgi:hypothetical protein